MELEEIISEFSQVKDNIYDIMAIAYDVIVKAGERNSCVKYLEASEELRELDNELANVIRMYSKKILSLQDVINKYIQVLLSGSFECEVICVELIHAIDRFYEYAEYEKHMIAVKNQIGPLNSSSYTEKVVIYTKPKEIFIQEVKGKANFRRIMEYDPKSINSLLKMKKFIVLRSSIFNKRVPKIFKYIDRGCFKNYIEEQKGLKIGLVPFCGFVTMNINTKGETFSINGPKKDLVENIVSRYIKIIEKMIEDEINIAVFPELVLIEEAYQQIREFLRTNGTHKLKLIFCGSKWQDKSNVLYVITGTGNELLQYRKVTPFEYKKDGKEYVEAIIDHENELEIIDIDGVGRVISTICRDYLNKDYIGIPRHALECNFAIVSAYSPSVNSFCGTSDEFCKNSLGITVLCNSCEPVVNKDTESNHNIGYISVPVKEHNAMNARNDYYCYNGRCVEECKTNICYSQYMLMNNDLLVEDNIKGMIVRQRNVKVDL